MFKFIRRIIMTLLVVFIIVYGYSMYSNFKQQSNLINSFTTMLNKKTTKIDNPQNEVPNKANDSTQISKEIYDILSDGNNYDLAIKCDGTSALITFDSNSKEPSVIPLNESDNFNDVMALADKYIDFDAATDYSIDTLKQLKDKISNGSISEKYKIVKDILNNTDTNIKETDLINIYFKFIAQK